MLQCVLTPHPSKPQTKQVLSLSSNFFLVHINHSFSTLSSVRDPSSTPRSLASKNTDKNTQLDFSSKNVSGIVQSVLSKCSCYVENRDRDFANASLKGLLLEASNVIPRVIRRYWRVSELKPQFVLDILLGFQSNGVRGGYDVTKVRCLWEIFKRENENDKGFKHLPKSCEIMVSMLVHVSLLGEAELLLSKMESQGIHLDSAEVFCHLIEGYVGGCKLGRAISFYDRMRSRGLVPSRSCYCVLLNLLVQMKRIRLSYDVCLDMVDSGIVLSQDEKTTMEEVIRLLCNDGKIQEARNLVKKVLAFIPEVSNMVLDGIAIGYCEKKDYEDLISFFVEIKSFPSIIAGNRVIHSLCSSYGTKRADAFMRHLEEIGFCPDEVTYGILISWSCREGKLKNALSYISEMLRKNVVPHRHSYNALICGVFKEGMWKHARCILEEMIERGLKPDLSTYRVLLAGYCKAKQFDEVQKLIDEMVKCGLIQISFPEDPLSKAFNVLGFNPLSVRLKRDNDARHSNTEFFDNLGNGLYLDTNLEEYETRVTQVLEDSIIPDFNSLIRKESGHNDFKTALLLVNKMVHWGQELDLPVFSELVRTLSLSRSQIKAVTKLLEQVPRLASKLDEEALNFLVQAYSKKGFTSNAKIMFGQMLQSQLHINNETYTFLIKGLCKKKNLKDLDYYWNISLENNWLPRLEDLKHLVEHLCSVQMIHEVLELLELMLLSYPSSIVDICHVYIKTFSAMGFSSAAFALLEELQGCFVLDSDSNGHLIRGLYTERKFSMAFSILDNMLSGNLALCSDVILLIPQLCKSGKYDKALALKDLTSKEQHSFSLAVHKALIDGYFITGKIEEAESLFHDMLSKELELDDEICNILVHGQCRANNLRKAKEVFGVAIKKYLRLSISSYRDLLHLMLLEDKVCHALSLKDLMLGQSKFYDLIIYNILIFFTLLTGKSSLVNKILNEMEEKEVVPDEVTYNFLVYGFSRCKDLSTSAYYLTLMISKELRPSNQSLRMVISGLCNVGELQKAMELSQEMERRGWVHGSSIQNAITEGLLSCGMLQEAENFVKRMIQRSLIPENISYDNLIKLFCGYGRLNVAVDLLDVMLKKHNLPDPTSYDSVICGFCAKNKLNTALDFHAEMSCWNLKPSIHTWEILVCSLCKNGQNAEAELFLSSMVQAGQTPTKKMYCSVLDKYRLENNLMKASQIMQAMQQNGYEPDFETHWSLISNLSSINDKDSTKNSNGFLSRLLSKSGFSGKKKI